MEVIKIFWKAICYKSRFYKEWLIDNNLSYDFYELENNKKNMEFFTMFYPKGEQHFPIIVLGKKTLRNPSISKINKNLLAAGVEQLEDGYSEVLYNDQRYSVTKESFNKGRCIKVFAENLSDGDYVSFNMYKIKVGIQLKPCVIPEQKVVNFLKEYKDTQNISMAIA